MIKNYFKTAWRNITKNKFFSLINIMGLGLAIPFALLCLMQVQSAFESDNFHPYPDRTYRINTDIKDNGGSITKYALSPQQLSEDLRNNYPSIQKATFMVRDYGWELSDRLKTLQVNTLFVQPSFFDMFGFHFISGSRPTEPNSIAITKEKAEAFFGTDDVVGKVLSHPEYGDLIISGVMAPFKRNTVFRSDVMVSMSTRKKSFSDSVPNSLSGYTYVLMKPNTTAKQLKTALDVESAKLNQQLASLSIKESLAFHRQGIEDIAPAFEELQGNSYVDSIGDLEVNFAFAMGLLILAAFNYINLTLARSINRAKEVGLRKTVGALRYQLILQFICEAVLMALLSLVVGYIVLQFLKEFSYVNWFTWEVDNQFTLWITFILFTIFIGTLAGFIPAKILSRFRPVNVLKGNIAPAVVGKTGLRNTLVVIQFVASACFIFILVTMFNQFNFMATDNENFNRENIYNIASSDKLDLLKHDVLKNKNVKQVGFVSIPFGGNAAQALVKKNKLATDMSANYYAADAGFVSNMQLPIIAGKNLLLSSGDSASPFVLVNEQLSSALGFKNAREAVGKTFLLNNEKEVTINGVLSNFCYSNYQFAAQPLIIQYNPSQFHVLNIQTRSKVNDAVFKSEMNAIWKKYFPHEELSFSDYQKDMYEHYFPGGDMKFMGMFGVAVLVIALLGLLGIVTYHTETRVKEVGIRKVMGASVKQIVKELSKSFVKLTLIAAAISLPLGYSICFMFMKLFAYSNGVNLLLLALLFGGIFSIALLIIAYKSIQSAIANPVKSLRTE
jgi:putative ABC transport system permease protein